MNAPLLYPATRFVARTGDLLKRQVHWAFVILYFPTNWIAKAAVLFQLTTVFTPHKSGKVYRIIHGFVWGNGAIHLAIMLWVILKCTPPERIWNPNANGHCISIVAGLLLSGVVNVVSDLLILLLPIYIALRLQLRPNRKAVVVAVFSTGAMYAGLVYFSYGLKLVS